jgi:flagellar biogenesis protein FliO
MLKELLSIERFQSYSAFSLLIFVVTIVLALCWVFRPGSGSSYQQIAKNILEE